MGQGPDAADLSPPPANFTDPRFMRGETPYDFFHVISLGKRGTAMPEWDDVLSIQDRWDVVSYLWSLSYGESVLAEGQGVYLSQCASCHAATQTAEWDASVPGAHVLPSDSKQLKGLNFTIVEVTNSAKGQNPTVKFKLTDNKGNAIKPSSATGGASAKDASETP